LQNHFKKNLGIFFTPKNNYPLLKICKKILKEKEKFSVLKNGEKKTIT